MEEIRTEAISYTYSEGTPFVNTAIKNVSLSIEKGEFVGIIGATGSGKSTLIQHLNGLIRPDSGRVFIGGEDIWAEPKNIRQYRFRVGLVFQYPEYQLFEESVGKDIAFGPRNMGLGESEVEERVRRAATAVGLSDKDLAKSPFELSGGEKRRVAIAGVLAMEPEVLILDEPTAGLDPKGREKILSEIDAYHKATGATVILVSHSMEDVARFAGRVLIMEKGTLASNGTVRQVFGDSEKLSSLGLTPPEITQVFALLREKGIDVPKDVFTVEEAKTALLSLLGKGDNANA